MPTEKQIGDITAKVMRTPEKLPDFAVGVVKGIADLAGTPVDMANEVLGLVGLKSEKPTYGSKFIREALFGPGAAPDKNVVETVGSFTNPIGGAAGVGKAMIVAATRKLADRGVDSYEIVSKIGELNTAAMMENEAEAVRIFKDSGIFTGHEGQAKSFISDAQAYMTRSEVAAAPYTNKDQKTVQMAWNLVASDAKPQTLEKVLSHPELYRLYPELKKVRVVHAPGMRLNEASFGVDDTGPIIRLGSQADLDTMKSTLLHEVQHGVQRISEFARGGNINLPEHFFDPKYMEALKERARVAMPGSPEKAKAEAAIEEHNAAVKKAGEEYRAIPGEREARFTEGTRMFKEPELKSVIEQYMTNRGNQKFWEQ